MTDVAQRGSEDLRAWAAAAIARARATWPGVAVTDEELAWAATARVVGGATAPDALDALDAAELYIAIACARGDGVALVQFRARYFEPLVAPLTRMGLGAAQRDDVWQNVCDRLFVPRGDELPRVLRYAGRGDLHGLVRVAATRMALNWLQRDPGRRGTDAWIDRLPSGHADPELHAIKLQHRGELKEEIEAAIASLDPRERMLLRLHLVERVSIDAIAALCAIHRATAARSVARAKEALGGRVRARLMARWRLRGAELPALKALVESQLDLSLERLLAA